MAPTEWCNSVTDRISSYLGVELRKVERMLTDGDRDRIARVVDAGGGSGTANFAGFLQDAGVDMARLKRMMGDLLGPRLLELGNYPLIPAYPEGFELTQAQATRLCGGKLPASGRIADMNAEHKKLSGGFRLSEIAYSCREDRSGSWWAWER